MGLVTQRNQKLEKLFNDLAIDPKEKAKEKAKSADQTEASDKNKQESFCIIRKQEGPVSGQFRTWGPFC